MAIFFPKFFGRILPIQSGLVKHWQFISKIEINIYPEWKPQSMASKRIALPVYKSGENPIVFPDNCVYCMRAKDTELPLELIFPSRKEEKKEYKTRFMVPYCSKHAEKSRHNHDLLMQLTVVGTLIFIALFVLIIILNFGPIRQFALELMSEATLYDLIILGAVFCGGPTMGFIVSFLLGGVVFAWIGKVILSSFDETFSHSYISNGILGIAGSLSQDESEYMLSFFNESAADAFAEINNLPTRK